MRVKSLTKKENKPFSLVIVIFLGLHTDELGSKWALTRGGRRIALLYSVHCSGGRLWRHAPPLHSHAVVASGWRCHLPLLLTRRSGGRWHHPPANSGSAAVAADGWRQQMVTVVVGSCVAVTNVMPHSVTVEDFCSSDSIRWLVQL